MQPSLTVLVGAGVVIVALTGSDLGHHWLSDVIWGVLLAWVAGDPRYRRLDDSL